MRFKSQWKQLVGLELYLDEMLPSMLALAQTSGLEFKATKSSAYYRWFEEHPDQPEPSLKWFIENACLTSPDLKESTRICARFHEVRCTLAAGLDQYPAYEWELRDHLRKGTPVLFPYEAPSFCDATFTLAKRLERSTWGSSKLEFDTKHDEFEEEQRREFEAIIAALSDEEADAFLQEADHDSAEKKRIAFEEYASEFAKDDIARETWLFSFVGWCRRFAKQFPDFGNFHTREEMFQRVRCNYQGELSAARLYIATILEKRQPHRDTRSNGSGADRDSPKSRRLRKDLVLTNEQLNIMKALKGKAMNVEKLAAAVAGGNATWLYRHGLRSQLQKAGLVAHKRGVGWYSTEFPPPDRIVPSRK